MAPLLALVVVPGSARDRRLRRSGRSNAALNRELDMTWIMVAAVLVFFMQAGFLLLEIGFSRQKNVGAGVAKILLNLGIVSLAWWAVGYGINSALRERDPRHRRLLLPLRSGDRPERRLPVAGADAMGMLFGMAFCGGLPGDRLGDDAGADQVQRLRDLRGRLRRFDLSARRSLRLVGGGLLDDIGGKEVLDFAGSSVVHLTGATAGLAALLLLGARKGKYGNDGKPRAIPGHSMPLVGLGVLILWIGWFGFNAGSTLGD